MLPSRMVRFVGGNWVEMEATTTFDMQSCTFQNMAHAILQVDRQSDHACLMEGDRRQYFTRDLFSRGGYVVKVVPSLSDPVASSSLS